MRFLSNVFKPLKRKADLESNLSETASPEKKRKEDLESNLLETSLSSKGPLGVHILSEPDAATGAKSDSEVDIIAVHGLAGDSVKTWTHRETGKMWLKDFLPKQIPNARIMTYGYQSDPISRSVLGIMENAEGLLEGLKVKRIGMEKRPLIFIGHSLGGLVIKKAILKAKGQNDPLLEATFGIMFMGVPHNGADIANFIMHLTDIVKIAVPLSTVNLEELKRDSRALADLSDQFGHIHDQFFYISVFESETTAFPYMTRGSVKVVPDSSARLNLGNREIAKFSISGADHRQLCRFASANDDQYELVWANLLRMVKKALLAKPCLLPAKQILSIGSGSQTVPLEYVPAPKQKQHLMIPFPRHAEFVGRGGVLSQLDIKLPPNNRTHQRAALWGLGGIGKTQIALEFAYRRWNSEGSQKSIFWVHASSAARFEQDYRTIAKLVDIPGHDDPKEDVQDLVKQWFQLDMTGDWILIFDNADDLDIFVHTKKRFIESAVGHAEKKLHEYIPNGPTGAVLFTTRDLRVAERLAGHGCGIKVEKLEIDEGTEVFRHQVQPELYVHRDAIKLLSALDCFPLAIAQAAAYIRENGKTLREYLDLYLESNETQRELLGEEFDDLRRDPTITNSVMTTWYISFEQIKRQSLEAVDILYIMSVLDQQGVPRELVRAAGLGTKVIIDKALGLLMAFSFITLSKDKKEYEMHRLVYLAIQTRLGSHRSKEYAAKGLALLSANFPGFRELSPYLEICNAYAPHITAILTRELPEESNLEKWNLLKNYGIYVHERLGKYKEAERFFRLVLGETETVLGPEHPDTLISVSNLALVLQGQGKYKEAEKMHRRVLEASERVFGPEYPDTLASVNNLASVLQDQGKYEEAEEMHRRVLEARERVLGPEHPNTLTSVSNLASVLRGQGKYEEAEKMHRRVLEASERVLGPEHPKTLTSVNNLALVLQDQGKYKEAEKMHRQVLGARERVLGPEHPNTLVSKWNLATALRKQEKYEEAHPLYRQAHEGFVENLGNTHPYTINCLSGWNSMQRERDEKRLTSIGS